MDFSAIVEKRYSVRAYLPDPVEEEKLNQVLEAACLAPTAANHQPFRLIVVHTAGKEEELRAVYGARWLSQAPVVICVCAVPAQGWRHARTGKNYCDVDAAIVMDHIILQATDLGLGSCWIAAFDHEALRNMLRLPDELEPVVLTPLGYPADAPQPKMRRSTEELVRYERWHD